MIREVPIDYWMRGMFFGPLVAQLGPAYRSLSPHLLDPPRMGLYLPMSSYPTRDFLRLFDACARRLHPSLPAREAYRRRARREVEVFAATALGRVSFSLVADPASALLKFPEAFGVLTQGPLARAVERGRGARSSAADRGKREVEIQLSQYFGSVEYPVGALEALVMAFGREPRIAVERSAPGEVSISVSWSEARPGLRRFR